jgi:ATP-dependent Clp protease ATP-binding subunit ClpC
MTSRLAGSAEAAPSGSVEQDGEAPTLALGDAHRYFRPQLLNRVDEQILFRPLEPADALRITQRMLRAVCDTLRHQHGVTLAFDPHAESFVARSGFSPAQGVRELERTIERLVQAPLSTLVLDGRIRKYPAWRAVYDEGGVYFLPSPATRTSP